MSQGHMNVPFYATLKPLSAFAELAGLRHKDALRAVLMIGQAMADDARSGLRYCTSGKDNASQMNIRELFQSHLEIARRELAPRDVMVDLAAVDPVPLRQMVEFMEEDSDQKVKPVEALTAAISLSRVFYESFGDNRTGKLEIPAVYPQRPINIGRRHIYLMPSA
ncbi:MAG: hypothetical protein HYS17_03210 [Micavibrio aeruginosavorus]|uniref:Uncharacterized protein n=1 Tax=Micavibrio aeruginosavorus TaxID=349221 RepID=A0A7T5R3B9_9BACT|nr:MAG: hypothetical protein HYS17_03210 [Micavibrio aeruginosavorus]